VKCGQSPESVLTDPSSTQALRELVRNQSPLHLISFWLLSVPFLSSRLLKRGHLRCIKVNRDNVLRIFWRDDLNGHLLSVNAQARCAS